MVDVNELYNIAVENREIGQLVSKFMRLQSAQAVCIRAHPLLACRLLGGQHSPYYYFGRGYKYGRDFHRAHPFWIDSLWLAAHPAVAGRPDDLMPIHELGKLQRYLGPGSMGPPIQVVLQVNTEKRNELDDVAVSELTSTDRLFVTAEWRPQMRLQFFAGDNIVCGAKRGTMGGFVTDGTDVFGVTCAHVAGAIGTSANDLHGSIVGLVKDSSTRTAMSAGSVCTLHPAGGESGAATNVHDCALVEMASSVAPTGMKSHVVHSLRQGDSITVGAGASSKRFVVRSLCYVMAISDAGIDYCFTRLVELYSQAGTTTAGESGSWGLTGANEWATMTVGADSISTFGIDARNTGTWVGASQALGTGCWSVY